MVPPTAAVMRSRRPHFRLPLYCLAARGAPRDAGDGGRRGWNGPEFWMRRTKTSCREGTRLRSRACLGRPRPLRQSVPSIVEDGWLYRGVIRRREEERARMRLDDGSCRRVFGGMAGSLNNFPGILWLPDLRSVPTKRLLRGLAS